MLWLTRQSLKRPPITIMLALVLLIAGVVSSISLKRELFPDISFPIVSVTTIYPGASSEVLDQEVTALVEKAVQTVPGVEGVQSTSSESFAFTIIQFDVDADPAVAKTAVREKISGLALPEGAQEPTIGTFDFNSLPIVVASISGGDVSALQAKAESDLVPALAAIPGVNNVAITGGAQKKVLVTLDPAKLAENNLTQAQVIQFLQANNLVFPVGTIQDSGRSLPLRITHQYSTTAEIENVVVGIKGVNLAGGAGGFGGGASGLGGGLGAPAPSPTPVPSPTASPTKPVTGGADLIPAPLKGFGITSPEQITPEVIAQLPDSGLVLFTPELVAALPAESQAALAQRAAAAGPTGTAPVTGTLPTTPVTGGADLIPAPLKNFGITSPEQITPEIINQFPAEGLALFTPELTAALPAESQAALAQRLNAPSTPAAPAEIPEALLIRLKDIGEVEIGATGGNTVTRVNGEASLGLEISRDTTGNTVEIVDAVQKEFDAFRARPGNEGLSVKIVAEQGSQITKSVNAVVSEGLIGAIVAVVIIFLFLRSTRSTLITAVSIPLSIVVALILMRLQGFSLNVMTLGGLTVAVGRVIDDSIVVLENIYRHINRGDDLNRSVIDGTKEVAGAITASTITTVCVFLPLGLVGGIVSKFFLPFALTVTYALLASLVVALTVIPLLARLFLRRSAKPEPEETLLQRWYTAALKWSLRYRGATLVIAGALLLASCAAIPLLKVTFLPDQSEKNITLSISLPAGTNLEATSAKADEIEALIKPLQDQGQVRDIQTVVGRAGGADRARDRSGGAGASNRADFTLILDNEKVADPITLAKQIETQVKALPGVETAAAETIAVGGSAPGTGGLDITLVSADVDKLREANDKIMAAIGGNKASDRFPVANVKSSLAEVKPELQVTVDPQKAIKHGTSAAQIALQIRALLAGERAGDVTLEGQDQLELFVQVDQSDLDIETLRKLPVGTVSPVALEEVAEIEEVPGASSITRINGDRAASISGQFTSDNTFQTQDAIEEEISKNIGLPEGVLIQAGAQARSQTETFANMGLALLVAIMLVYIVMMISFGSLLNPLIILCSVLMAIIGVVLSLLLTGKPAGITTMIGLLMLVGIVVTNGIVLVELVEQYREERGMSAYDALLRAGRVRLRPILMTAIATIVALIPLALGLEEGGFIGADLGVVVIGGLFTSTFLTLLVVPVVYSLLDGLKTRFGFGHKPAEAEGETQAA